MSRLRPAYLRERHAPLAMLCADGLRAIAAPRRKLMFNWFESKKVTLAALVAIIAHAAAAAQ